jgi:hypothetical protein
MRLRFGVLLALAAGMIAAVTVPAEKFGRVMAAMGVPAMVGRWPARSSAVSWSPA